MRTESLIIDERSPKSPLRSHARASRRRTTNNLVRLCAPRWSRLFVAPSVLPQLATMTRNFRYDEQHNHRGRTEALRGHATALLQPLSQSQFPTNTAAPVLD